MSICVQIQPDGTLQATGDPVAQCTAYILMEPLDLAAVSYWGELALAIPPGSPELNLLMAETATLFALAYVFSNIVRRISRRA